MDKHLMHAVKAMEECVDQELDRLSQMQDDDLDRLRLKRLEQLRQKSKQKDEWLSLGHGTYSEISDEREFFLETKKSNRVICHFYRSNTFRCKIVDKHLSLIAPSHLEAKFIKVDAEKVMFLCEKLKIRIIPTICCIIDNKVKDTVIGFDDVGGKDDFPTSALESRLVRAGVIDALEDRPRPTGSGTTTKSSIRQSRPSRNYDDSDDD